MPPKAEPVGRVREVGRRLKRALKETKQSQVTLSKLSGVDPPALSRFLDGKVGLEAERLLGVLQAAAELDISVEYVVVGSGPVRRSFFIAENERLERELIAAVRAAAAKTQHHIADELPATGHRRR